MPKFQVDGTAILPSIRYSVYALLLAACLGHGIVFAETITGRVVGVSDGDTLTLLSSGGQQVKVRLSGIDAPERKQAFGERAKRGLSDLAFGQSVVAECPKIDRYARSVCLVTVNGTDVGLEQIKSGMAWWYRQYGREQTTEDRRQYEDAELNSRALHVGLWSQPYPISPWEWRRSLRGRK